MTGYIRPEVKPPVNSTYRPRNYVGFGVRIDQAKGLTPTNTAEAALVFDVALDLLEKARAFMGKESQYEVMQKNLALNERLRGIDVDTLKQDEVEEAVPEAEPIKDDTVDLDDGETYSEADEEARVAELKTARLKALREEPEFKNVTSLSEKKKAPAKKRKKAK